MPPKKKLDLYSLPALTKQVSFYARRSGTVSSLLPKTYKIKFNRLVYRNFFPSDPWIHRSLFPRKGSPSSAKTALQKMRRYLLKSKRARTVEAADRIILQKESAARRRVDRILASLTAQRTKLHEPKYGTAYHRMLNALSNVKGYFSLVAHEVRTQAQAKEAG